MIISIWDDEYGISVHSRHQTTKENISEILKGFQRDEKNKGFEIIQVKGWNYPELINAYEKAEKIARKEHVPVMVHVLEMTQPQGHSTSGSHERYKSKQRLEWEDDVDCIKMFGEWIISNNISTKEKLEEIRKVAKKKVSTEKNTAWKEYQFPIAKELQTTTKLLEDLITQSTNGVFIKPIKEQLDLEAKLNPHRKNIFAAIKAALRLVLGEDCTAKEQLKKMLEQWNQENQDRYSSHLHSESALAATKVTEVAPTYDTDAEEVDARVILKENFDYILSNHPESLVFGEDSGQIGGVNQGLEGMQEKHGEFAFQTLEFVKHILGQGIGMAMRGLRPIAEVQYLDYLLYCFQGMSDDLATLHYRTKEDKKHL